MGFSTEPMARSQRVELAKALVKANGLLHQELPILSPAEANWLDAELAAKGKRMMAAWQMTEYQKRVAKQFTEDREQILKKLASPASLELQEQVRLWSFLASSYNDNAFSQAVVSLADRNVIDSRFLPKVMPEQMLDGMCRMQSSGILDHIIIPYLGNDLGD
jgi:hypothetical protein